MSWEKPDGTALPSDALAPDLHWWITRHIVELGDTVKGPNTATFIRLGVLTAWESPDILKRRLGELRHTYPVQSLTEPKRKSLYMVEALDRLVTVMPLLPDKRAFFAAVCLCSVSEWSRHDRRLRPAAALLVADDIPALREMMMTVVLNRTQAHESSNKRPPSGILEELRSLGIAVAKKANFQGIFLGSEHGLSAPQIQVANRTWEKLLG
jgi:hypothetical protein